jgi:hypothetical protein
LLELVANIHGELEFVGRLLADEKSHADLLTAKLLQLEASRDALYATVRQFDSDLDSATIGTKNRWFRAYSRGDKKLARHRYLLALVELANL